MFRQPANAQNGFGQQGYMHAVAHSTVDARLAFIRKVYACLCGAIVTCMGTVALAIQQGWALQMAQQPPLLVYGALILCSIGVFAMANVPKLNILALGLLGVLLGLYISPLVFFANLIQPGSNALNGVVGQAFILTSCVFTGLTAYVFVTRKDFSWMRGALWIGFALLIGFAIISMLFGFQMSQGMYTLYLVGALVLFTGFTLYDTSQILHKYPEEAYVQAAMALFIDFVNLFMIILQLLMNRD